MNIGSLKNIFRGGLFLISGVGMTSCMSEQPFQDENGGAGLVKLNLKMNSELTRAVNDNPEEECFVYLSDDSGLIHKWHGINEIPSNGVYLKYGSYLAEAWAGDSVAASFDNRYFKGETRFEVSSNQIATNVTVNCKIANVVVSVDASELREQVANTLKIEVESTTGSLSYDSSNLNEKGYFMRNYDESEGTYDNVLNYTLSGIDIDGTPFSREGVINDILPAHEYRIILKNRVPEDNVGGAAIQIQIREFELEVDDTVIIHGKPEFAWQNNERDIESQLYDKDGSFTDQTLFIAAYNKFKSIILSTDDTYIQSALGWTGNNQIDLVTSSAKAKEDLAALGVIIEDGDLGLYQQFRITFTSNWLNGLQKSADEYVLKLKAIDERGMTNEMSVRIANTEEALDDPLTIDAGYWTTNKLSINPSKAEVSINLYDDLENLSILYRKVGSGGQWIEGWKASESVTIGNVVGKITGLEEGTDYECKAVGGNISDGQYQYESGVATFTTEKKFAIPNSSFEEWTSNGNIVEPHASGEIHSFWDTGNHGTTLAGFTATEGVTEIKNQGSKSARLKSQKTLKFGAGNLFCGEFGSVSGLNGARVNFGKPYNGSHPTGLKFYAHYRPVAVTDRDNSCPDSEFQKGIKDYGQVYVALSTGVFSVNTNNKQYFDKDDPRILAYGEVTWKDDFGPDDGMSECVITFEYYDKAKITDATHIIIVASASKYGDYFSGGAGSTLYLDDFELVYE